MDGDDGMPVFREQSPVARMMAGSARRPVTPRSAHLTHTSLQWVKKNVKDVQRPDLVGGVSYGSTTT